MRGCLVSCLILICAGGAMADEAIMESVLAPSSEWGPAHHEDDPWGPVRWTTRTSHG